MLLLILKVNLPIINKGIPNQIHIIQFFFMHTDCRNLMVVVGRIIVDAFVSIAAGSVNGSFILPVPNLTAPSGLRNRPQNMKELADAFPFGGAGNRIHFYKSRSDKTGLRRQISGKPQRAHTETIRVQCQFF